MPARVGRAEDERDVVGRLLERLEEDVPALLDALDLVDDEDLAPEVGRGRGDARQQLAHVVDLVVRRRVHLDHVERTALADRDAGRAAVVRLAVDWRFVQLSGLGDDPRHRRLARAARADEEERVGDAVRSGRRCAASRRPWPPGRRSGRTSGRASAGRWPGGASRRVRRDRCLGYRLVLRGRRHGTPALRRSWGAVTARCGRPRPRIVIGRAPSVDPDFPRPSIRATRTRPFRGTRR